ncbi:conserved hypothetical protein [Candidatus Sulfotelmatobacter kueseliae]|uniref:Uncharacterized protein n=1 Tax=Candidatus Sulfotelmatobacter kueseliae TaxID=2042962 RepID=A0A2U3K7R4_9BACT|nr:conserved hypothetical protein [Candidatus Sulfotelmatobacter kueseliae]
MEFHLLYSGSLHSERHAQERSEKHAIRKSFHNQLKRLWQVNSLLKRMAEIEGRIEYAENLPAPPEQAPELAESEAIPKGLARMSKNWNRNSFDFLPLVTAKLCLRCRLEILFLRPEERNYIRQGGDLDRRLITLFDAMRIPEQAQDLPPGAGPENHEYPFFCLLQDDELISEVEIKAAPLLVLPEKKLLEAHDVYLQINVCLNTTRPNTYSWVFG